MQPSKNLFLGKKSDVMALEARSLYAAHCLLILQLLFMMDEVLSRASGRNRSVLVLNGSPAAA